MHRDREQRVRTRGLRIHKRGPDDTACIPAREDLEHVILTHHWHLRQALDIHATAADGFAYCKAGPGLDVALRRLEQVAHIFHVNLKVRAADGKLGRARIVRDD